MNEKDKEILKQNIIEMLNECNDAELLHLIKSLLSYDDS